MCEYSQNISSANFFLFWRKILNFTTLSKSAFRSSRVAPSFSPTRTAPQRDAQRHKDGAAASRRRPVRETPSDHNQSKACNLSPIREPPGCCPIRREPPGGSPIRTGIPGGHPITGARSPIQSGGSPQGVVQLEGSHPEGRPIRDAQSHPMRSEPPGVALSAPPPTSAPRTRPSLPIEGRQMKFDRRQADGCTAEASGPVRDEGYRCNAPERLA